MQRRNQAFTLIELLIVIAIILVLAAITMPVVRSVLREGKIARAQSDVHEIDNAITAYFHRYGELPFPPYFLEDKDRTHGANDFETTELSDVYRILVADDDFLDSAQKKRASINPDRTAFLRRELPEDYILRDPWQRPYRIRFDANYSSESGCCRSGPWGRTEEWTSTISVRRVSRRSECRERNRDLR